MDKVLIVEDSKVFARILIRKIEDELFFDTCWASNFEEARYLLDENPDGNTFFVALLDLHLPDAEDGPHRGLCHFQEHSLHRLHRRRGKRSA